MNEQRKNQRFELKLPIELVKAGSEVLPKVGETRNVSSSGVLFTADGRLQKGELIEYLVTLPSTGDEPVRLRCMGKVVRVDERAGKDSGSSRHPFAIAATLERHEFLRH